MPRKMSPLFISTLIFPFLRLAYILADPPDYGYSSYCQRCLTPCEKHPEKGYYWCKNYDWIWNNEVYSWDYCSPNKTSDHWGRLCSSACAFHGEDYQWCTSGEDWGQCSGNFCSSQSEELPDYGYSTYCQRCITPCQQTKTKNYWCGTRKWKLANKTWTWDYCSPDSGVDFQGSKCLGKCKFRGNLLYMSCPTGKKDSKDYCTGHVLCDFVPQFD